MQDCHDTFRCIDRDNSRFGGAQPSRRQLRRQRFRLLTAGKDGKAKSYYPVAFLTDGAPAYGPVARGDDALQPQGKVILEAGGKEGIILQTALVYQIPEGSQAVRLVFRRVAIQNCPRPVEGMP